MMTTTTMVTMMVLVCKCQGQMTAFGSRLSPSITGYRDQTQVLRPGKGFSQLNRFTCSLLVFLDICWQVPGSPGTPALRSVLMGAAMPQTTAESRQAVVVEGFGFIPAVPSYATVQLSIELTNPHFFHGKVKRISALPSNRQASHSSPEEHKRT